MKGLSLWETRSWVSGQDIEESTQQICNFVFPTKLVMLVQFVLNVVLLSDICFSVLITLIESY